MTIEILAYLCTLVFIGMASVFIAYLLMVLLTTSIYAFAVRVGMRGRWAEALGDAWRDGPVPLLGLPSSGDVSRPWALLNREMDASLHLERTASGSDRIIYSRDLREALPPEWSFTVTFDQRTTAGSAAGAFFEDASTSLRARGPVDLVRALERVQRAIPGATASLALERGRITARVKTITAGPLEFFGAQSVEDPRELVGALDDVAAALASLSESSLEDVAAQLARRLDAPNARTQDVFIALVVGHPHSPELGAVLERALGHDEPLLRRCAMLYSVDPRVWERWSQDRGDARSYMRGRAAALARLPQGPGRVLFVRDLIDRCGLEQLARLMGSFRFGADGKPSGADELFAHRDAWAAAFRALVEDSIDYLSPAGWTVLLARYLDSSRHGEDDWIVDARVPRGHALLALSSSNHHLEVWLAALEGDASDEVVDVMLARIEFEIEGIDFASAKRLDALSVALAERSITRALPTLHLALERRGNGLLSASSDVLKASIASITAGLDPGVVGGMSVAEDPASRGGLSVTQHADAGALSESASSRGDVVLDLSAEEGAEDVEAARPAEVASGS